MSRIALRSTRHWKDRRRATLLEAAAPEVLPSRAAPGSARSDGSRSAQASARESRRMAPYEMSYDVTHGYAIDRPIIIP